MFWCWKEKDDEGKKEEEAKTLRMLTKTWKPPPDSSNWALLAQTKLTRLTRKHSSCIFSSFPFSSLNEAPWIRALWCTEILEEMLQVKLNLTETTNGLYRHLVAELQSRQSADKCLFSTNLKLVLMLGWCPGRFTAGSALECSKNWFDFYFRGLNHDMSANVEHPFILL